MRIKAVLFLLSIICLTVKTKAQDFTIEEGKVMVSSKVYCLYDEPKKGSKSFTISNVEGEVMIQADVEVISHRAKDIDSRFRVLFVPSYKELIVAYDKAFNHAFLSSFIKYDVLQDGFWNDKGASQLYNEWSVKKEAIVETDKMNYVSSESLTDKIAGKRIRISTEREVYVDDTLRYTYSWYNNQGHWRYRKNELGAAGYSEVYTIYDTDSNLVAQVNVSPNRTQTTTNIMMVIMPEQEVLYLRDIYKCKEEKVVNTAIKVLLIRKMEKS